MAEHHQVGERPMTAAERGRLKRLRDKEMMQEMRVQLFIAAGEFSKLSASAEAEGNRRAERKYAKLADKMKATAERDPSSGEVTPKDEELVTLIIQGGL